MKKRSLLSLVMALVLVVGAAFGTYAWFTSSALSKNNTINSGNLVLDLNVNDNAVAESQAFTIGGELQPGQIVTNGTDGWVKIEIVNNGDIDLSFLQNFVLGGNTKLAEAIYIKNAKNYYLDKNNQQIAGTYDQFITNGTGYPAYFGQTDGKISLADWVHELNYTWNGQIKGGWQIGGLKPQNKYVLEFQLAFDENAGNEFMDKVLNVAVKTYATQANIDAFKAMVKDPAKSIPYVSDNGIVGEYDAAQVKLNKQN